MCPRIAVKQVYTSGHHEEFGNSLAKSVSPCEFLRVPACWTIQRLHQHRPGISPKLQARGNWNFISCIVIYGWCPEDSPNAISQNGSTSPVNSIANPFGKLTSAQRYSAKCHEAIWATTGYSNGQFVKTYAFSPIVVDWWEVRYQHTNISYDQSLNSVSVNSSILQVTCMVLFIELLSVWDACIHKTMKQLTPKNKKTKTGIQRRTNKLTSYHKNDSSKIARLLCSSPTTVEIRKLINTIC